MAQALVEGTGGAFYVTGGALSLAGPGCVASRAAHMVHSLTVHLALGALLIWCTMCGTGREE